MPKKFWNFIRNAGSADGEPDADLLLYGDISDQTWWGDEVTPKLFKADLDALDLGDGNHIRVRINSNGGDLFAGQTIYSLLKSHPAKVTTRVDGLAASAASIIAMAGDTVEMPSNSMMMMHNPQTSTYGDARDHRNTAEVLDAVREPMISVYSAKSGADRSTVINQLNAETWMTADQAKQLGYADKVLNDPVAVSAEGGAKFKINNVAMDFSNSRIWPGAILATAKPIAARNPARPAANTTPPAQDAPAASTAAAAEPEEEAGDEAAVEARVGDAVKGERKRISDIEKLSIGLSGVDAFKASALEDGTSADAYARQLIEAGVLSRNQQLDARREGAQAANVRPGSTDGASAAAVRDANANAIAARLKLLQGASN